MSVIRRHQSLNTLHSLIPNDIDLLNPTGDQLIAKLQMQATSRHPATLMARPPQVQPLIPDCLGTFFYPIRLLIAVRLP